MRKALTVLLALAVLAACAPLTVENPFNSPPVVVQLGDTPSAPVAVRPGQTLLVALDANVTTGFRWEVQPGFAPTLTQIGTSDYLAPADAAGQAGASGTMTFRFRAAQTGTAALTFVYRRPFEPDVAPAKTVRYDVTVG